METRIIKTKLYRDSEFRKLSDKDKLIVIYLLTNEFLEVIPAVRIELDLLSFHCSTNAQYMEKLIVGLSYFEIFYRDGYLIVGEKFTYANYLGGKTAEKKKRLLAELQPDIRELLDSDGFIAQSLLNHCSSIEHINHKTKNINKKTEIINTDNLSDTDSRNAFQSFWELYPRKIAKKAAQEKYISIVKKNPSLSGKILEGLQKQLPMFSTREIKHIPHASTWLNQARWEDEVETEGILNAREL